MGDIVERDQVQITPIVAPSAPTASTTSSFPPVEHRNVSRFAKQRQTSDLLDTPPPPAPSSVLAAASQSSTTTSGMFKEVNEENDQKLATMSSSQIEEMRQEVFSSMDQKLVEILRKVRTINKVYTHQLI